VPVLARILEAAGLATVLITMMPYWVERIGVPRTLAVEFPFGQPLGRPNDAAMQTRVLLQALDLLEGAPAPGTIVHSTESWPEPTRDAQRVWQPQDPSPIIRELSPRFREMLRDHRRQRG
jgi:hypothetical protein